MISAEKVMNIKVVQLVKIYNVYFGHLFIRQTDSNIVHKSYISLLKFHKLYKRDVKFVNNVTITLSDEQINFSKDLGWKNNKNKLCRS
jgi:uncharacterized protein YhbP (UPF0306 family)